MSDNLAEWTVMVNCAADNDLSRFAVGTLAQMYPVILTDQVHVVAQVDLFDTSTPTYRFIMRDTGGWFPPENIPEANGGDPENFVNFVKWAVKERPAKKYLIVLWGHGAGADDSPEHESIKTSTLDVATVPSVKKKSIVDLVAPVLSADLTAMLPSGPTLANNTTHADIGLDVHPETGLDLHPGTPSSALVEVFGESGEDEHLGVASASGPVLKTDALTTRELAKALELVAKELEGKIHVFGMDACLMGMVEVAQELSPSVQLFVASQQTIPDTSWPYGAILRRLVAEPTMDERALAQVIVDEYIKAYKKALDKQVTLSVCDLGKTSDLIDAFTVLRGTLDDLLAVPILRAALFAARRKSLSFFIRDFVDLYDFCKELQSRLAELALDPETAPGKIADGVSKACEKVKEIISPTGEEPGFVLSTGSNAVTGGALERARGVSIYFPVPLPLYKELAFSKKTQWARFLDDYAGAYLEDESAAKPLKTVAVETAAIETNGNGHQPNLEGVTDMSSPVEVSFVPCLALFENTSIEEPGKPARPVTSLSFLEMGANRKVKIPGDVDLDVPNVGTVKASGGTPVKLPTGTMVGSSGPVTTAIRVKVPACILREPSNNNATTELGPDTKIVVDVGGTAFLVLESVEFEVDAEDGGGGDE